MNPDVTGHSANTIGVTVIIVAANTDMREGRIPESGRPTILFNRPNGPYGPDSWHSYEGNGI